MSPPFIIIADDDRDLLDALACRCRGLGLAVETATDSMAALRRIEQREPDLVILDVDMPAGSGLGVCDMMSHHERLCKTPVIILTGKKDPETVRRCHALSCYYVTKCDDIWPRIEPLLCELLEPQMLSVEASGKAVVASQSSETDGFEDTVSRSSQKLRSSIELMDRVSAALGSDEGFVDDNDDNRPEKEISRPWVLCIDDDSDFSFALQQRLNEHGVDVLRAFAGMEGYRYAVTSQARAIVLDYKMPDGNGDYVLRRLKESSATRDIPVIVLTGHRENPLERKMYSLGAASVLSKPYDWPQLWGILKEHLTPEPVAPR